MQPLHLAVGHFPAELEDLKAFKLIVLNQCDHNGSVPRRHRVKVSPQIARPSAGQTPALRLTWTQGDAKQAHPGRGTDFGYLKRVADAGARLEALHRSVSHILLAER